ncbi:hypothetical protein QAD02_005790 [Eretmocerus hayati]|uniref:Uncharacterized protein n=1 Tax=Eretmocerus hayati TaxID=131215 RepID=A0ACC2NTI5_9HYME|nr:hypothetical protein QAD02_005790 [Eretmocerus hayati]
MLSAVGLQISSRLQISRLHYGGAQISASTYHTCCAAGAPQCGAVGDISHSAVWCRRKGLSDFAVEHHPVLYNPMDTNVINGDIRDQTFEDIAISINLQFPEDVPIDGDFIKREYKRYRGHWNHHQNQLICGQLDEIGNLSDEVALSTLVEMRSVCLLLYFSRHRNGQPNRDIREALDALITHRREAFRV